MTTGTIASTPRKPSASIAASMLVALSNGVSTNETAFSTSVFYAVELTVYQPGTPSYTFNQGHGTAPRGAFAQNSDGAVGGSSVTRVSDTGYRTSARIDGDPNVYPPLVTDAFQIDRRLNLPPSQAGIAASWGTLSLNNASNQFSNLVANWNNDGRPVTIYYGTKSLENFAGWRSNRTNAGSYITQANTIAFAGAQTLRVDWTTGLPLPLNEPAATNLIANAETYTPTAGDSAITTAAPATGFGSGTSRKCTLNTAPNSALFSIPFSMTAATAYAVSIWLWIPSGQGITSIGISAETANCTTTGLAAANLSKTNQWQRIAVKVVSTVTQTVATVFRANPSGTSGVNVYVCCPQIEAGNTATSYIQTFASSATRTADNNYRARGILLDPAYSALNTVFTGLQQPWLLSESTLQVPLRDASYWLDRPLQTNLYSGAGSYSGTAALTGQPLPMTRGGTTANPICNVSPTLIDPVNLIYQYNDAAGTVVNLYQGGALTNTRQTDTTNLYAGTTTAGSYRTDNSRGLFQLGTAPTAAMTADVTGNFPVAGAQTTALAIAYYLMKETVALPAAYLNTTNWSAAIVSWPYVSGFFYSSSQTPTGLDAVNQIMFGFGAKLFQTRGGTLQALVLRSTTGTVAANFDTSTIIALSTASLDASITPPPYRIRVGYNHNYTVQTSGLLGAATQAHTQVIAQTDQFATALSSAVASNYLRPNDLPPVAGSLLSSADAATVASDLLTLWGTRRRLYNVTVPLSVGLPRDIGDVVILTWPVDSLSAGQAGQIVGETFHSIDATTTFTILV